MRLVEAAALKVAQKLHDEPVGSESDGICEASEDPSFAELSGLVRNQAEDSWYRFMVVPRIPSENRIVYSISRMSKIAAREHIPPNSCMGHTVQREQNK